MTNDMTEALPVAVCVFDAPAPNQPRTAMYPEYIHEVLQHAGLCYQTVTADRLDKALPHVRVLITVGEAELPESLQQHLYAWVHKGGAWLSIAGCCGMEELFGVTIEPASYVGWASGANTLGEGYLDVLDLDHPVTGPISTRLHYFNGIPVSKDSGECLAVALDAHQHATTRAAVTETEYGEGCGFLIAPDITGALVHIQQGRTITRDGVPSNDGTAPSCDGVLKADDGAVLDYIFDRQALPGVRGFRAFLEPQADHWRDLLIRSVLHLARKQGVVLPVLWFYPRNVPALGHISHDTDGNESGRATVLLGALDLAGIKSTWCTLAPGYSRALTDVIREAGHELAVHYDAMSEGREWSEDAFDGQWRELCALFGERPSTNKNHYLRWQGDTEFYGWLERHGITLDQSKGPSKTGQAGFLFGTSHPYFPIDPKGLAHNVLELPTLCQDLVVTCPPEIIEPLLEAVLRHHGVLHLLFHPAHIDKPGVSDALQRAVRLSRQQGVEWWTARQINAWERARREIQWSAYEFEGKQVRVRLNCPTPLPGATLLWLGEGGAVEAGGEAVSVRKVNRWGFNFTASVLEDASGALELTYSG